MEVEPSPAATTASAASQISGSSESSAADAAPDDEPDPGRNLLAQYLEMVLGGTLRLEMLDGRGNFLLAHEAALDALGLAPLGFGEEHVAVAHELLGTGLVEDDARVYVGGDEQPDAVGDVRLDHARDDVARGALGCDDEVDAGGTCELGDAHDRILDVLARRPS